MNNIKSAQLLLKAARDLEESLLKPYEEFPENPKTDFLNAVVAVSFFSRIVFNDLVSRQGENMAASWAWRAAVAVGDLDEASRLLDVEILELKREGHDLEELEDTVALSLKNHKRSNRWETLLIQIEKAKTV